MIKFVDLFCGIGGFRLGIKRASEKLGIPAKCVFSSEIEKNAVKIYEKNFQETPSGDITKINADDIPDMDILCGGFPCQAFSISGNRRGFEDTRGTLFFDIARIARDKRPNILFLENVRGLLSHDRGRTFAKILLTMDELDYDVEAQLLNSKDFGVPQNRERLYIIGHLRGSCTRQIFPVKGEANTIAPKHEGIIAYPVLYPDKKTRRNNGRDIENPNEPMFTLTAQDRHGVLIQHYCGSHQQDRVLDPRGISSCLTTGAGGDLIPKFLENGNIRKLTPVECERLQGFPDGWTAGISDSGRYKCLGNAVTVNVIEAIASKLLCNI